MHTRTGHRPIYTHLYFQVLVAIGIGVVLGYFYPATATAMKPFGDGFIKLIKMMIAPIIFTTVVVGIAKIGDMKKVGRVGLKALIYFELVSTLALAIGLVVVNVVRPGSGINADVQVLDAKEVGAYTTGRKPLSTVDHLLHIIPDSAVGAFAGGEILQVLTFSVLFGLSLGGFGEKGIPWWICSIGYPTSFSASSRSSCASPRLGLLARWRLRSANTGWVLSSRWAR